MADAIERKMRQGTTAQNDSFTGALGEMTFDTTLKRMRAHDAVTAGGLEFPNFDDIHSNAGVSGTVTGTNTLVLTLDPPISSYDTLATFIIKIANNNTGAVTINVNGLGAKSLYKIGGSEELETDDLVAGGLYLIGYDGSAFQLIMEVLGQARPPILLETKNITSGVGNVDFTSGFTNTLFDEIVIKWRNLELATNGAFLHGRLGTGGGPTFQAASGDYDSAYSHQGALSSFTWSVTGGDGIGQFVLCHSSTTNARTGHSDGQINIIHPRGTTFNQNFFWRSSWEQNGSPDRPSHSVGWGTFLNGGASPVEAITGFRMVPSSGNIDGVVAASYGIRWS